MARVNQTGVDPRIAILLDQLDYAFDKPAWHGPNLASSLRGIDHRAAAVSLSDRKSIWEQALHAAYWKQRVVNKLIGTQKFPRRGSNWPPMPESRTAKAWRDDMQLLHDIHAALRRAVEQLERSRLDVKTIKLIIGAAAHDNYHTGQIKLLRRMLPER